jgi:hypothetical protein
MHHQCIAMLVGLGRMSSEFEHRDVKFEYRQSEAAAVEEFHLLHPETSKPHQSLECGQCSHEHGYYRLAVLGMHG